MNRKVKNAIEEYQCTGCVGGYDTTGGKYSEHEWSKSCGAHTAGTSMLYAGTIYLGLPTGFNRLGVYTDMVPRIKLEFDDDYDAYNVPVWKYRNEKGHVIVRGMKPRLNEPFLDIFLEDCLDKITCIEITDKDISKMD